nr:unnamed protein product [Digitaria exilis]
MGGGGAEVFSGGVARKTSAHEVDDGLSAAAAAAALRNNRPKPRAGAGDDGYKCPICHRSFMTIKAFHGHMAIH